VFDVTPFNVFTPDRVVVRFGCCFSQNRAQRTTQSLLEVVKCNGEDINLPSFIHRVVQAAYGMISCERISLYLVDAVKRELWMAVSKVSTRGFGSCTCLVCPRRRGFGVCTGR
jgi:hypothetical protein